MEAIIRVENLKKYYSEVRAVDDISFEVEGGELFGFLGVNGAGKSTTINMLCTLLKPTSGKTSIAGYELGKEDEKIKHEIGVVYQNNCLDPLLTVKENLMLRSALYERRGARNREKMMELSEILDLGAVLNRSYGKLSGGQKRRCEIARALMHTPKLLFLDEPTTGLDPANRQSVWDAVRTLQKEMKMTVFLTTHYMEEAAKAGHIGVMNKGKLIQLDTPFALKEKFAKDRLRLIVKEQGREAVERMLDWQGTAYKTKEDSVMISLPSTMDAYPILQAAKECIRGFEVIQGTMDDVFLEITEEKEYV